MSRKPWWSITMSPSAPVGCRSNMALKGITRGPPSIDVGVTITSWIQKAIWAFACIWLGCRLIAHVGVLALINIPRCRVRDVRDSNILISTAEPFVPDIVVFLSDRSAVLFRSEFEISTRAWGAPSKAKRRRSCFIPADNKKDPMGRYEEQPSTSHRRLISCHGCTIQWKDPIVSLTDSTTALTSATLHKKP